MSHVVFLLGSYYPNFSAVGNCAYQVHKCLADNIDISVVSFRDDAALPLKDDLGGINILRVETASMKRRNELKARSGLLASGRLFLLRARGAIRRLLSPKTIDQALVRAYLDRLNSMGTPPIAVVPLVFPFETVIAALAYKEQNPGVLVYPYLFDDFVESGSLHVLKIARMLKRRAHLRLERNMLEKADTVLSMHPLRAHFEANFEKTLLEKVTYLEHPLLTRPEDGAQRIDDGIARLCFTGSLIRNVREPDYLLDLLRAVRASVPIRADFFVMGNEANKVRTETVGDAIRIVNHGRVQKIEADAAVRKADILINLGEVRGKQVSSKVFEYMATGKPIIHLAYVEGDEVSTILSKYPLAMCLVQDRQVFDENVRMIGEFITKHRTSLITFDEVKALFPEALPSTTVSLFMEFVAKEQN